MFKKTSYHGPKVSHEEIRNAIAIIRQEEKAEPLIDFCDLGYAGKEEKTSATSGFAETVIDGLPGILFILNAKGHLIRWNKKLEEVTGFSSDELAKMRGEQLTQTDGENSLPGIFHETLSKGKPFDAEMVITSKTNKRMPYYLIGNRLKMNNKSYVAVIGRDISERRRFEAQLFQAQKMESVGTLAGGIAHNFNNLLMGIQGNASIIMLNIHSNHPFHKHLKNIESLVSTGSKLTNQLLGYARGGRFEIKPIDLNILIKETTDTFGAANKDINIHLTLADNLYQVKADQGQIEQTLLNLYFNAADAMAQGGNLAIETKNVTNMEMQDKPYKPRPGKYILLTIKDSGIGMDKKIIDRIFEPFFTTKGLAKGTGLGLAAAYGIVKGHGGYIDVDSKLNCGTTFNIYLPAIEKEVLEEETSSNERINGKGIVLLVDDEDMVLDTGRRMLKKLGFEVLVARNGHEALELFRMYPDEIDMVLLDMVMPDMGGSETYDKIKNMNPNIKVLLASGYGINGQAAEILERGCNGFIQKPFSLTDLSREIRNIFGENE